MVFLDSTEKIERVRISNLYGLYVSPGLQIWSPQMLRGCWEATLWLWARLLSTCHSLAARTSHPTASQNRGRITNSAISFLFIVEILRGKFYFTPDHNFHSWKSQLDAYSRHYSLGNHACCMSPMMPRDSGVPVSAWRDNRLFSVNIRDGNYDHFLSNFAFYGSIVTIPLIDWLLCWPPALLGGHFTS